MDMGHDQQPSPVGNADGRDDRPGVRQVAVLWLPHGESAPAALIASLAKRGTPSTVVQSGLLATAHACAAHLREGEHVGALVVLVKPERLQGVSDVCLVITKYAPRARVWVFEPKGAQPLRAVTDQDLVNWGAQVGGSAPAIVTRPVSVGKGRGGPARAKANPASAPALRLAGDGPLPAPAQSAPPPSHAGTPSTSPAKPASADEAEALSADELAMLLGRDAAQGGG